MNYILGFYSFFLTILYVPTFYHGAVNPRWAFLAVLTSILLFCFKPNKLTSLHLLGILFIFWSCITLIWSFNRYDSADELIKLLILAQVFVLGSRLDTLKHIFIGIALGLIVDLFSIFSLGWKSGLFVNPSIAGETAILVIIGLIIYKYYIFIPPLVLTVIYGGSRTAIVAGLGTIFVYCYNKNKLISVMSLGVILIIGIVSTFFGISSGGVYQRFDIWEDSLKGFSLLGQGTGAYHAAYPFFAENINTLIERPRQAHNDFIQVIFETGIVGIVLVSGFIYILTTIKNNEKYIITAFIILALLSFPIHMPVTAFIFAIITGYMSRNLSSLQHAINISRTTSMVRA